MVSYQRERVRKKERENPLGIGGNPWKAGWNRACRQLSFTVKLKVKSSSLAVQVTEKFTRNRRMNGSMEKIRWQDGKHLSKEQGSHLQGVLFCHMLGRCEWDWDTESMRNGYIRWQFFKNPPNDWMLWSSDQTLHSDSNFCAFSHDVLPARMLIPLCFLSCWLKNIES